MSDDTKMNTKGMGQIPPDGTPELDALVDLAEAEDQQLIATEQRSLSQGQMVRRRFRNH